MCDLTPRKLDKTRINGDILAKYRWEFSVTVGLALVNQLIFAGTMVIMLVYEVFLGFPWDFYRTNCTKVYYWRSQDQTKSQPLPSSGVDWDGDSCWGFNKPTWGYSLQFYDRKMDIMGYIGID